MALGWFLGGALFGSVGIKALGSKEAKKVYSKVISYGLEAKDCVMETADGIKEGWDDVYADAQDMRAERDAEREDESLAETIEDESGDEKKKAVKKKTTASARSAGKGTARKTPAKKTGRAKKSE